MMERNSDIIIIGGGLSGLTLAWELSKQNKEALILEASDRLGGRIQTIKGALGTPLELGATWFSDMHPNLLAVLKELQLVKYTQFSAGISLFQTKSFEPAQEFFVPESENPSYRLAGGTQTLIEMLAANINTENTVLNARVTQIEERADKLMVTTDNKIVIEARKVIICLPPQLAASTIQFTPSLPTDITELLPLVQTWMAGAIKFVVEYEKSFWRNKGYSGMLYSHAGIIMEMYDHTNIEKTKFGFTGFLNGGAAAYAQELRKELVIKHLTTLLGEDASNYTTYADKIWNSEYLISGNQSIQQPHQFNGHPLLQQKYMDGKLLFSGSETASEHPGYMEGAVIAAKRTAKQLQ